MKSGNSLVGLMRRAGWFLRSTAGAVLLAFGSLTFTPVVLAAEHAYAAQEMQAQAKANAKGNMGQLLVKVRDELRVLADKPDVLDRKPTKDQRKAAKDALKALRAELHSLDKEVRAEFAVNQDMITAKKLAAVIQERQDAAVAQYAAEYAALEYSLAAIEGKDEEADARGAAASAYERLAKQKLERSQQAFDPNDLPNKSLKPDRTRVPKTDPLAWVEEGLVSNPQILVASTAPFDYSKLAGAGNPAYLAATTEVVLTDAIRAKAAELDHDPVKIYEWVRNNVVWQPTWGAIQDAELTLSAQRGNAFDISSLLIALYRASGIPARYVHGTIDVPEADFRSWMGDWQHLNPAIDFASAGGIPIRTQSSGGRISKVRMEHIWVEAAIDFMPSRGVKNVSADTWLALDPSFKRMRTTEGLDAIAVSGIAPDELVEAFLATGEVNEAGRWSTGFDRDVLNSYAQQLESAIGDHVATNLPEARVADVIGGLWIIDTASSGLPSSLPNQHVVIGARYAAYPDALRQSVTFSFIDPVTGDATVAVQLPMSSLNNKAISLGYKPASAEDAQVLASFVPSGGFSQPSDIPSDFPAYLIRVIPEIRVQGETVLAGTSVVLGSEQLLGAQTRFADGRAVANEYRIPAGSYVSLAAFSGVVSERTLTAAAARFEQTRQDAAVEGIQMTLESREAVLGEPLHLGLATYYAKLLAIAEVNQRTTGGRFLLASGLGSFGQEAETEFVFGMPRKLAPGNAVMNIPLIHISAIDSIEGGTRTAFIVQMGAASSILEHAVPEQIFSTDGSPGEAISAMKAIALASANGQRVYGIDAANQSSVLPLLQLTSAALAEIRMAIANGHTVIAHPQPVTVPGWSGFGYVVLDTDTGDGAFKISGGANGSSKEFEDQTGQLLLAIGLIGVGGGMAFAASSLVFILFILVVAIDVAAFLQQTGSACRPSFETGEVDPYQCHKDQEAVKNSIAVLVWTGLMGVIPTSGASTAFALFSSWFLALLTNFSEALSFLWGKPLDEQP